MRTITIKPNDAGQRLDKFMAKTAPTLPKSLLYKYLRKKCFKVNGSHITDGAYILSSGDVLSLYISDEFFDKRQEKQISVCNMPKIVYEDENIILLNKPAGQSVHPDEKQTNDTLSDRLKYYLYSKGEYDPKSEQSFAPALCNRLDRNTTGIVIAAKNANSLREMNDIIKNREVEKRYKCVVHGILQIKKATLRNFLLKDPENNEVAVFDAPVPGAKTAILDYEVEKTTKLNDGSDASILNVLLHTGRTHQIRAQLSHIGHSIVGDGKYGNTYASDKKNGYKYQALCAYSITFKFTNEYETLKYLDKKNYKIDFDFGGIYDK